MLASIKSSNSDFEYYMDTVKYNSVVHENEHVYFWKEGEILCSSYKKNVIIGAAAAKEVIRFRKEHFPGNHLIVVFLANIKCMDDAGKKVFASEESLEGIIKGALITNILFQKIVGNFYLSLLKTHVPTKLFTSKSDAVTWLLKK